MIVVSDTSPITNLIQIDRLNLLKQLFGRVIIPPAVYEELCEIPEQANIVKGESWIETEDITNEATLQRLKESLDKGEAEAIALALHFSAEYLLIDETRGRAVADEMGIRIIGLLGILIKAKAAGIITAVKPVVDALISKAGFYIRDELYQKVLMIAHER